MTNMLLHFMLNIKTLGFGNIMLLAFVLLLIHQAIAFTLAKIETLLEMEVKYYWYDIPINFIFIFLFVYLIYIYKG